MFESTRIKLTAWYLVIIMFICAFFSFLAYRSLTAELTRSIRSQSLRNPLRERIFQPAPGLPIFFENPDTLTSADLYLYEEIKHRIVVSLITINTIIFVASGFAAYFLAGRTLGPIEKMIDEQKRFISDASHELRTPLTSMKTQTEVALRDKKLSLTQAKELLASNLEETNKIHSLTNYLLSLSRYENSTAKVPMTKIDLEKVINETVDTLVPLASAKKITIEKDIISAKINGNEDALNELVKILIDNAIKYSNEGGLVVVGLTKTKRNAKFSVADNGIGIKASDTPYIFNRFYRADISRTKDKVDGYGLGLAIAKSIAESHSAIISVVSTLGKGSTFNVVFPF